MAKDFQLEFQVHDDNHEDGNFIFDASAYRYVRVDPRSMRLFWLGAYPSSSRRPISSSDRSQSRAAAACGVWGQSLGSTR